MEDEDKYLQPRVRLDGRIYLAPYDDSWPVLFAEQARRIEKVLGPLVRAIEHVGSTSVPGLAAKPIIDINLLVPDTRREDDYVPPLLAVGYSFQIREPDWYEHRLFRAEEPPVNLHVFSEGCAEHAQMMAFRDHLRKDADARKHYQDVKTALAERRWRYVQDYADAKSGVIGQILADMSACRRN